MIFPTKFSEAFEMHSDGLGVVAAHWGRLANLLSEPSRALRLETGRRSPLRREDENGEGAVGPDQLPRIGEDTDRVLEAVTRDVGQRELSHFRQRVPNTR